SSVDAGVREIHAIVHGQMQGMEDHLIIPAGETDALAPAGAHFMHMEVKELVMAGDEVPVTVELADGSTEAFDDVPVRNIGGGDESYGGLGHDDHGDHGDHDDHDGHGDQDES